MRDSTCYSCSNCLEGNPLGCESTIHGPWKKYQIAKESGTNDIDSGSESDSDMEDFSFECEESDSEDDDEEGEECLIDDSCLGRFVLYKFMDCKYYVGSVIEESVGQIVVRLARRHSTSDKIITFVWPDQEDVVIVDCDLDESVRNLPNPISSRRGLSFYYEEKLFGKLPSGYIQ